MNSNSSIELSYSSVLSRLLALLIFFNPGGFPKKASKKTLNEIGLIKNFN
jgi:hypothetical protein